jgi:hypothetical protein
LAGCPSPQRSTDTSARSASGARRQSGCTTRQVGYDISQRCRKRIEEVFGWIKSSAGLAKVKLRGRDRVDASFTLAFAVA